MKKLYFMGMGMDYDPARDIDMAGSDVGNYRIRTTFHDKNGDIIFVEFGRGYLRENKKVISSIALRIDFQFNKSVDEDCNKSGIKIDYEKLNQYRYTKKDIVAYLNETFGTEFDDIEVLERRFSKFDCDKYCGDEFTPNYEEIEQAKKIYKYFYKYEKEVRGKEYPNHSAYFDGDVFKVLIHYNCYNDYVIIDNVFEYDFNYQPPAKETLDAAVEEWNAKYKKK